MTEQARSTSASGLVLAGGGSARFGRDKLAETVDGERLLHRAIRAVAEVCAEVVVAIGPEAAEPDPPGAPAIAVPLRFVRDEAALGGPLHGVVAGLEVVSEPVVLVVGGDMPMLRPEILRLLLGRLGSEGVDAAALSYRGRIEPLPFAVRNGAGLPVARQLVAQGEGSLRALLAGLSVELVAEADWRPLDPTAATLRDVDEPGDLSAG